MTTQIVLGIDNSLVWRAAPGTPERDRYDVAWTEQFQIRFHAQLFTIALREARRRFGDPTHEEFAAAFTTELIDPVVADMLAHGAQLILTGDCDAGANVVLPRVETIIRNMVRRTGQAVIVEPSGDVPGGVRSLGVLLNQLRGALDEGWRRYLVNALVDPLGLNLRNRALHGLLDRVDESEATVVLHIAAYLTLLRGSATPADGAA
jgi:hypothetical protein